MMWTIITGGRSNFNENINLLPKNIILEGAFNFFNKLQIDN